jgi:chromosome partitioning protein
MSSDTNARRPAHVVVLGNVKGGSGKSTTAMHIAVALLHLGQRT